MSNKNDEKIFDFDHTLAWYIVRTKIGSEEAVAKKFESYKDAFPIERVLIPFETELVVENNKLVEKHTKKFSAYVFVQMYMTTKAWYIIRNTRDVFGFLGSHGNGTKPTPVSDAEMLAIIEETTKSATDTALQIGDHAMIASGPFLGQECTVNSIIGNNATVSFTMFDRENEFDIELENLIRRQK